jgi:DNA-binding NarL/FixJ family response regulator
MPITVLVAEDGAVVRKAIRLVLALDREIKLVGEAEDFAQTVQMAAQLKPQVLVMDLHMPVCPDLAVSDLRKALSKNAPRLVAMSFSIDDEAKNLAATFGAQRLLDKTRLYHELIPAIRNTELV